jgi:PPOX class probable F420-dependent enzyme
MLDLSTEFGQRVNQQLQDEQVIWLTTVTPGGVAQPNPVWFYWDGQVIIVYSQPDSFRIRNIRLNHKVTLNLQGADVMGNNVVVICGEAFLNHHYDRPRSGYEAKYSQYLPGMSLTFEQLIVEYSVEIIITPTALRGN